MDVMECAFDVCFLRGTRGINRKSDIYDVNEKGTVTVYIQICHELRMSEMYVTLKTNAAIWFNEMCKVNRHDATAPS